MAYANELDLMRDDCLGILSAGRTVTLIKRTSGTLALATGKKTPTTSSSSITAIRGEDTTIAKNHWQRVYMISAALKLTNDDAHKYQVTDVDGTWDVIMIRTGGDGRMMQVLTERKS